jgi:hypothetical protein
MIYASTSTIVNTDPASMWGVLEGFIKLPQQGRYIRDCKIIENYYDGFKRSISIADQSDITERVFLLKDQYKIVMRLENHPLCIGDTIFQIIASDMEELSDRRVTICAVLAWRMRPGVIEAPSNTDKQKVVEDLLQAVSGMF